MDKKYIIVFGATGSLGVYLTEYLRDYYCGGEYEIIAVGRRKTEYFSRLGITYFSIDIQNREQFSLLPQSNVYAAVHLANILPARVDNDDPRAYFDVNINGTINILEYMRAVGARRIVFTQTYADIAGHWGKALTLKSDLPRSLVYTGDHAFYAISKCAVQDIIEAYHQQHGIDNFVLRLPNIYMYSPEEYYYVDGVKTLISYRYIINMAINGETIELWGNPDRVRDMVYVKDFCQLVLKTLLSERSGGVYNVGTGVGTTLREQFEGIVEVFSPEGKRSEIVYRPEKRSAMEYIMDIENAKTELGYKPEYMYRDYLLDYKKEMNGDRFLGL